MKNKLIKKIAFLYIYSVTCLNIAKLMSHMALHGFWNNRFFTKTYCFNSKRWGISLQTDGGSFGVKDSSGAVVLDFRVVDFLDFTLRLCLSRSVENLLLTSSLALLDSTLPKIRQNDEYCWVLTQQKKFIKIKILRLKPQYDDIIPPSFWAKRRIF